MEGLVEAQGSNALRAVLRLGLANPRQVAGMTGLELLKAMARGDVPAPPMSGHIPMRPEVLEEGRLIFRAWAGPEFANPMGLIHGGWYSTVLDTALGLAVTSTCAVGESAVSTDTAVRFTGALRANREHELLVSAEVEHRGRRTATSRGRVEALDGRVVATATSASSIRLPKHGS